MWLLHILHYMNDHFSNQETATYHFKNGSLFVSLLIHRSYFSKLTVTALRTGMMFIFICLTHGM